MQPQTNKISYAIILLFFKNTKNMLNFPITSVLGEISCHACMNFSTANCLKFKPELDEPAMSKWKTHNRLKRGEISYNSLKI